MLHQVNAEHFEFSAIPAADDVQREAAARNRVNRGGFFRDEHRMHRRRMGCGKYSRILGRCSDSCRPRECFEHDVRRATGLVVQIALPASDGNDRFQARAIRQARRSERVCPSRLANLPGTELDVGDGVGEKVPLFSLLSLKIGFVGLFVTLAILPEIREIAAAIIGFD